MHIEQRMAEPSYISAHHLTLEYCTKYMTNSKHQIDKWAWDHSKCLHWAYGVTTNVGESVGPSELHVQKSVNALQSKEFLAAMFNFGTWYYMTYTLKWIDLGP